MLSGDPPFAGTVARALLARKVVEPPPPLRHVCTSVSPSVETAILKALAAVPSDRFDTMQRANAYQACHRHASRVSPTR